MCVKLPLRIQIHCYGHYPLMYLSLTTRHCTSIYVYRFCHLTTVDVPGGDKQFCLRVLTSLLMAIVNQVAWQQLLLLVDFSIYSFGSTNIPFLSRISLQLLTPSS